MLYSVADARRNLADSFREAFMIRMQNILVATDFSDTSQAALDYGRELARGFHATLHVLHVTDLVYAQYWGGAYDLAIPELQGEIEAAERKELDQLLTDVDRNQLHAKAVLRTAMSAPAAIVDYATERQIDLIVMGTQGRGVISRVIVGSVAERVVRTAPCPVLTVHHPEHEFIQPDALVTVART
jgi:nucleotide-binding universal stress UspA family protein